MKFENRCSTE